MKSFLVTFLLMLLTYGLQRLVYPQLGFILPAAFYLPTFFVAIRYGAKQTVLAVSLAIGIMLTLTPVSTEPNILSRTLLYAITCILVAPFIFRTKKTQSTQEIDLAHLNALQKRFERSGKAINLGIWYCDLPFKDLIWNEEVKRHFWLPSDAKVTIDTFYERIHPDDREKTKNAIEYSIANNAPYDLIYRTTNPLDLNQVKYIRAIGWTDYNAKNDPVRFDGITLDNTELFQTSQERNESLDIVETINRVGTQIAGELDLQKLVQSVTDAATQLSKAQFGAFFYNVISENGEAYTLYAISGVPREKFSSFPMPRNTAIFAPTFNGERIVRSDDITKDPAYGKNAPYFGKPKGHLPVVSYLAVPVISRSGEVIGGLFFGHEQAGVFTEKAERIVAGLASQTAVAMDNARLYEKARHAITVRDEFLSISSHELKTPLTPLTIQLQSIVRQLDQGKDISEEKIRSMLYKSLQQVSRLNRLVDDLLDVTRISSGKLTLNLEKVNLREIIQEISERFKEQLEAARNKFDFQLLDVVVEGDKLRLEQVYANLLINAIKYAPGSELRVELRVLHDQVEILFSDKGPGIPEQDQNRIFDRFERSQSTHSQSGLGLGLFICKQIVEAHQGRIELLQSNHTGTTFSITLPLKS